MQTYEVKKIYTYSETVFIEAESSKEAKDIAMSVEGERNHDDSLYDCEIIAVTKGE